MEDFITIYRILRALKTYMGAAEYCSCILRGDVFDVTQPRLDRLLFLLSERDLVANTGTLSWNTPLPPEAHPRITLKGLEYLETDPLMQRAARWAAREFISNSVANGVERAFRDAISQG